MHYALIEDFGSGLQLLFWAKQDLNHRMPIIFNSNLVNLAISLNVPYLTKLPRIVDNDMLVVGKMKNLDKHYEFIQLVQERNIEWNLLLDSWVNYNINENLLPNNVWVTDSWAFEFATRIYQNSQICIIENHLLRYVTEKCLPRTPKYLLYTASPPNDYSGRIREVHAKSCICSDIERIQELELGSKICIRFHPGYRRSPCEVRFLQKHQANSSDFQFSESLDFTEDLQNAEILFGPISYLHYLSESIQIPSFSTSHPTSNWKGPQFRSI
jgi:hypothetical protein